MFAIAKLIHLSRMEQMYHGFHKITWNCRCQIWNIMEPWLLMTTMMVKKEVAQYWWNQGCK